jgi:hypothetical protein
MRADPPPPRADSVVQSVEAELALAALEAELKALLAERGIRACAMWDRDQHTYPVQVYAVPERHIVEPDPDVTGVPWHGLLGQHDATHLEPALDDRGSRLGTRLVGATFQIVVRPAQPQFVDVRFRPEARLAGLAYATRRAMRGQD